MKLKMPKLLFEIMVPLVLIASLIIIVFGIKPEYQEVTTITKIIIITNMVTITKTVTK
jgi:uncharacterized membrane protein